MTVPVSEYTSEEIAMVSPDALIFDVYTEMHELGIRHVPVVKDGTPVGIISDRDIPLAAFGAEGNDILACQVMSPAPFSIGKETAIGLVAYEMSSKKIGSALVLNDDGSLYGIFTTTDALNALVELFHESKNF